MLKRCYSEEYHRKNESYIDCSVSDSFKEYSNFYKWCQSQTGFNLGYELDKDLLNRGNKIYSEDSCVFIPMEINKALLRSDRSRGEYPIGVMYNKHARKITAYLSTPQKRKYLGLFDSVEAAFFKYKIEKEKYIKSLAIKYKDSIDDRAYDALMSYVVEITD